MNLKFQIYTLSIFLPFHKQNFKYKIIQIKMTSEILNGRYEIFNPTNTKNGAQGVVFFVKDKKENNEMYLL